VSAVFVKGSGNVEKIAGGVLKARTIVVLAGAFAALVLVVGPADAALRIHETVRTEQMSQDNDAVVAGCQKGEAPISGGFRTPSFNTPLFDATASFLGDGGWQASAQRRLGDLKDGFITSFAYCAKLGKKVETRGESASFDEGASGNLTASCKRSETLLSGGWAIVGSADDQGLVLQSQKTGKRSWTVFGDATSGTITVVALADCVPSKGAPELVTRKSRKDSSQETIFASCKRDEQVVSGGFTSNSVFVPFEFHRASKRKWGMSGKSFSPVPGTVTTFAYCEQLG
jgi:hypothetical protein